MTEAIYYVGDTRDITATLPDGSVDLVLTSPPFLALRSYLPADHPDKAREIGSEATPAEFLDVMLGLAAGWGRVLAPHGSIAIELGDTYSGSSQGSGDRSAEQRGEWTKHRRGAADPNEPIRNGEGWPQSKSLTMIPELFRIGLAYGINPLTGQQSPAGKWRVRNVVRWHRPNPPVGALGDKYRPATTDMVVACRAKDRWFDLDAVRDEPNNRTNKPAGGRLPKLQPGENGTERGRCNAASNPAGAPPLDTWTIPTAPYKGSHYATWPPALCTIPIESMCPREVCRTCGKPRRRITETTNAIGTAVGRRSWRHDTEGKHSGEITASISSAPTAERVTLGWSDCGHDDYRPGVVLDPFAGTGTTLAVATGHGRDAIGIDIDPRNADLARERVGMFLTVKQDLERQP